MHSTLLGLWADCTCLLNREALCNLSSFVQLERRLLCWGLVDQGEKAEYHPAQHSQPADRSASLWQVIAFLFCEHPQRPLGAAENQTQAELLLGFQRVSLQLGVHPPLRAPLNLCSLPRQISLWTQCRNESSALAQDGLSWGHWAGRILALGPKRFNRCCQCLQESSTEDPKSFAEAKGLGKPHGSTIKTKVL